jgi:prephenate dehydrogenase
LTTVRRLELAHETTDDPAEAASDADLVVIATPLSAYAEIGRRIARRRRRVRSRPMSARSSRR